jgi:Domain of unknown function (DUF222)
LSTKGFRGPKLSVGAGSLSVMSNLASAVDELLAADVAGAPDAVLAEEVVEIRRQITRLETAYYDRLAVVDGHGIGDAEHGGSTAGWLRATCHLAPSRASRDVHLARDLAELPITRAALGDGSIGVPHAQLIASLRKDLRPEAVSAAEPHLVEAAQIHTPQELRGWVTHVRHGYARDRVVKAEQEAYEQRRLHGASTLFGTGVGDWTLPPVLHETVMTAIHAFSAPISGDDRSPAQRRADALVTIAELALGSGQAPDAGGVKPHVTVLVTLDGLEDRAGAPAADYGYGATSSSVWLQRICCDADISRVVTGPRSEILDAGRATRTFTAAQRRAIVARDRHCCWPGCDRPAGWTEAHHIWHWALGGPTSVTNGMLLCGRHHDRVHLYGHAITQQPDGSYTVDLRPATDPHWTGPPHRAGP